MENKLVIKYAYEMDEILKPLDKFSNCEDFADKLIKQQLNMLKKLVTQIQPLENTQYDKSWSFWIPIPTGSFKHYLKITAKEEKMEPAELEEELSFTWEDEYSEKAKWYHLGFNASKSANDFTLAFDNYVVIIGKHGSLRGYPNFDIKQQYRLLSFIYAKLNIVIQNIIKNPNAYLKFLERSLPKSYRFGRIKRADYWGVIFEKNRVDRVLGRKNIKQFEKILSQLKSGAPLPTMTADNYFHYCAICYDANCYPQLDSKLSPIKKYKIMADMRDEGLTEIKGNSVKAFAKWYHGNRGGGHPWEIRRGGNTTHISLYISSSDNQWKLVLAGSSYQRVVETVRMALALYEHGIVVQLAEAEEIFHMVTGQDYIGLVPHGVPTRYCDSLFPEEDNIIDFVNPGMMEEKDYKKIAPYIYWYPLEKYNPRLSK